MPTDCGDGIEREIPELQAGSEIPAVSAADVSLITDPTAETELTAIATRDVHSAITHGLASYLYGLRATHAGRDVSLAWVTADWAEREDGTRPLPSAGVHSEEEGEYTNVGMRPGNPVVLDASNPTSALCIVDTATYELASLMVDVMCGDKAQREGVRHMLEDAANPLTWMGGFRLVLHGYHNAVAEFSMLSCQFNDSAESAAANMWGLRMKFEARCQVYRLHRLPLARPQSRGNIVTRGR